MAAPQLHLPLDWERRAAVVKLQRRLASHGVSADLSALYYVRMWVEWGSNPEEWRPLNAPVAELSGHPWKNEDLTFIIEGACRWTGEEGRLLVAAIEAGVYEVQPRGEVSGIVLCDWWRLNEHLSPNHKSMQALGGAATRMTNARRLAMVAAAQQAAIWEKQGHLVLTARSESADERKAALALVIQLDRHCGLAARVTANYTDAMLRDAVEIVRNHTTDEIDRVLVFLSENRQTPDVVKIPERVLQEFKDYLARATQG